MFLGREISSHKDYSEQTAELIDKEVRRIIEAAYERAQQLLSENMDKLKLIAETLLEREVLDGDQMNRVLRGEILEPLHHDTDKHEPELPAEERPARAEGPAVDPFRPPAPRPAGA